MQEFHTKACIIHLVEGGKPFVGLLNNSHFTAGHLTSTIVEGILVELPNYDHKSLRLLSTYIVSNSPLYVAQNGTVHEIDVIANSGTIQVSETLFCHPNQQEFAKQLLWLHDNHVNGYLQTSRRTAKAIQMALKPQNARFAFWLTFLMILLAVLITTYIVFFSGWTPPA